MFMLVRDHMLIIIDAAMYTPPPPPSPAIGAYEYTSDLLALHTFAGTSTCRLPSHLQVINTPLIFEAWERLLVNHPDLEYVDYILSGIRDGFRIGFNSSQPLACSKRNMPSAYEHADVIDRQLAKDCEQGFALGPFSPFAMPYIHISRIGVIPKRHQPGKWRIIVNLSSPRGKSINDGILKEFCSLSYTKVDTIVDSILSLGRGTLLAKIDVRSAFRIIPIHPADRHLLGIAWKDKVYIDAALPFGLRSAPKIFNAVADALEWIVRYQGVDYVWHYLDDFIMAGQGGSDECMKSLQTILSLCQLLGIPLAEDKLGGPATLLGVLGIEFDTDLLVLRLPPEKLARIQELLKVWSRKKKATKRDLKSLVGQLQHASTVVKPGRTFLRRMYDLLSTVKLPHHYIRLSESFRSDLAWWSLFLRHWDGSAMMSPSHPPTPSATITSDASGGWGCGAYCEDKWFQLAWPDEETAQQSITLKELAPIVLSAAVWGSAWRHCTVRCLTDNSAVVCILGSRTCRNKEIMHLLRCLHFFEAYFECALIAEHIPGAHNDRADDLSRNRLLSFLQKTPQALPVPTAIPPSLLDLLFRSRPDWLSDTWKQQFEGSLNCR